MHLSVLAQCATIDHMGGDYTQETLIHLQCI